MDSGRRDKSVHPSVARMGLNRIEGTAPNWRLCTKGRVPTKHIGPDRPAAGFEQYFDRNRPSADSFIRINTIRDHRHHYKSKPITKCVPEGGPHFLATGQKQIPQTKREPRVEGIKQVPQTKRIEAFEKGHGRVHYWPLPVSENTLDKPMGRMKRCKDSQGRNRRDLRSGGWDLDDICPHKGKYHKPKTGTLVNQDMIRRRDLIEELDGKVACFRTPYLHDNEVDINLQMKHTARDCKTVDIDGAVEADPHAQIPGYAGYVRGKEQVIGKTLANVHRTCKVEGERLFSTRCQNFLGGDTLQAVTSIGLGTDEKVVKIPLDASRDPNYYPPGYGGYLPGKEHHEFEPYGRRSNKIITESYDVYHRGLMNHLDVRCTTEPPSSPMFKLKLNVQQTSRPNTSRGGLLTARSRPMTPQTQARPAMRPHTAGPIQQRQKNTTVAKENRDMFIAAKVSKQMETQVNDSVYRRFG